MGEKVSGWPDELDDEGAMDRLQSILLLGCEGNQDLSRGRDRPPPSGPIGLLVH